MCGIVAFFNCGNQNELEAAVACVNHRGPDYSAEKWFHEQNTGLGHARLSIIDLSEGGNQPMYDRNSDNWIVYNGEVYNYREVRKDLKNKGYNFRSDSDTEVILKAYAEWGKDCLEQLNGMFSFVIYNEQSEEVFSARDRMGIKPFYYYKDGDKLIIASEIKSILESGEYVRAPDLDALHTPIHYQVSPQTGFKNIQKLEPGHFIHVENGNFTIQKYWDIQPSEKEVSFESASEELESLLLDSMNLQMISDVPIGALLSGGLDSSIICAMAQKLTNQPLRTFTITFNEQDLKRQGNVDDSVYAKMLAEQEGFYHQEILIEPDITDLLPKIIQSLEEPIADPSAINTYLISKEAKERGMKVLLSGMGADEVFSGYRSHLACLKADTYQRLPKVLRKALESVSKKLPSSSNKRDYKYVRWVKSFLEIASLPRLDRDLIIKNSALSPDLFNEYYVNDYSYQKSQYVKKATEYFESNEHLSYLTKLCYNDTKIYLPNHNLAYLDKAMMAASVEGRPPLIDHRIVEFMFSLPPEFRIKGNTQKYLLKKVAEKYLPNEIIYRPKAPFSAPMRGWLKNELKEMVMDILSYDTIKKRGIYNPDFVHQLIVKNDKGMEDNSQLIWRLMVNELWFQTYFDN